MVIYAHVRFRLKAKKSHETPFVVNTTDLFLLLYYTYHAKSRLYKNSGGQYND